ncbi:response regulator transcription factor [Roseimaritima sediminicola]|uniref:response regulator transcription factor n=1 Tax=Roseimaritima sediminicola TaxID=2662066 RepID=UPI0012982CE7|nr:response regulator transcription factor [Roseimaritima sediminicola]
MESQRILLVEDDCELAGMVADFLSEHGFAVTIESDGLAAAQRIPAQTYDALVLDIGLPGLDGISVCRQVRSAFQGPILMLTARGDEIDEVVALEVGADDYMSKPVRPRALLARLRVHLRRVEQPALGPPAARVVVNGLSVDPASRNVQVDGRSLDLTTAEFDLLWLLASRAGQVVDRQCLYQELHGLRYDGLDRSIDLRVSRLRKKIGDDPNHPSRIKSVRGVGYLLATES